MKNVFKEKRWQKYQTRDFDSEGWKERAQSVETSTIKHAKRFLVNRLEGLHAARRDILCWLGLMVALIVLAATQSSMFQSGFAIETAKAGGVYAEATVGEINNLNPLYALSDAELSAGKLMFSALYKSDKTGNLIGDLATKKTVDEDGKKYEVFIRSNARWHDGGELTASDVKFTVDLMKNPKAKTNLSSLWRDIEVTEVGKNKLIFTLPAPYAFFEQLLAFPILPKKILKDIPPEELRDADFSLNPVGSGPFKFASLQKSNLHKGAKFLILNSNNDYYKGAPRLSKMQLNSYLTKDDLVTALNNKEVTAAYSVNDDGELPIPNDYQANYYPMNSAVFAFFNNQASNLTNAKVRRALRLAIDVGQLRKDMNGAQRSIDLPFFRSQIDKKIDYSPKTDFAEAKKLLAEAGWKRAEDSSYLKKEDQPLIIRIVTVEGRNFHKAIEMIAKAWRDLGVQVETQIIDKNDITQGFTQSILQQRNYDVLIYDLIIGADIDTYGYWHSSQIGSTGHNLSNYKNVVADDNLSSARSQLSRKLIETKYSNFAKQWLKDTPAIGLFRSNLEYISLKNSSSIEKDSILVNQTSRYLNVTNWSSEKKSVYNTP